MKKIVCSFVLLAGLLAALCSCDPLNNNDQEKEGTLYGSWKLDTLTIEASASVIGSGAQNTSNIDFIGNSGYLYLSDANMATVKLGWDVEMSSFTFDAAKKTIHFNKSMDVSDDGKAIVLVGTYEIIRLTPDHLALRQPDFNIDIPGLFSSHQTAIYKFHRVVGD